MSTHLLQDAVVAQAQLLLLHPLQTLQNALVNRVLAKFSQGGGGGGLGLTPPTFSKNNA